MRKESEEKTWSGVSDMSFDSPNACLEVLFTELPNGQGEERNRISLCEMRMRWARPRVRRHTAIIGTETRRTFFPEIPSKRTTL